MTFGTAFTKCKFTFYSIRDRGLVRGRGKWNNHESSVALVRVINSSNERRSKIYWFRILFRFV